MLKTIQQASKTSRCFCRCLSGIATPSSSKSDAQDNTDDKHSFQAHPSTPLFERLHPIGLVGKHKYPLLKRRHFVLKKIEHVPKTYNNRMECILTQEVKGIGLAGMVVEVPKSEFRNRLYPSGAAVYASPENLSEIGQSMETSVMKGISYEQKQIMDKISTLHLPIYMNCDVSWALDDVHVKTALQAINVYVTKETIKLPKFELITSPRSLVLTLVMNERIEVDVKATIYPRSELPAPGHEGTPSHLIWDNTPVNPAQPLRFLPPP